MSKSSIFNHLTPSEDFFCLKKDDRIIQTELKNKFKGHAS